MAAITIIATMAAIIVTAITDTTTIIGATVITAFGIGSTGQRLLPPPEVMSPTNLAPPLAGLFVWPVIDQALNPFHADHIAPGSKAVAPPS